MHGLQLIRGPRLIIILGFSLLIEIGAGWLAPIRVLKYGSSDLTLAPKGYAYRGTAFTGIIYATIADFKLSRIAFVFQGKSEGPDIQWFENGQRSIERHYSKGLPIGIHKAWYRDGSVRSLKSFDKGLAHGRHYEWHSNGTLAQYVVFDHGREVVAKSWTAGGKPFYNYVWQKNLPVGLQGDTLCSPRKKN